MKENQKRNGNTFYSYSQLQRITLILIYHRLKNKDPLYGNAIDTNKISFMLHGALCNLESIQTKNINIYFFDLLFSTDNIVLHSSKNLVGIVSNMHITLRVF